MKWFDENELPKITDKNSLELAMSAVKSRFNGHPHTFTRNDYLLFINTIYSILLYLYHREVTVTRDIESKYNPNTGFIKYKDIVPMGSSLTEVLELLLIGNETPVDKTPVQTFENNYSIQNADCKSTFIIDTNLNIEQQNNMSFYYTIDNSDVSLKETTSGYTPGSNTLIMKTEGAKHFVEIDKDCTINIVAVPKNDWLAYYTHSKLWTKKIEIQCKNNSFIIEGGIDPINKIYKEYDVYDEVILEIKILEGSAVPSLTDFCLQHEVLDTQRLVSGECYVVIPKNKEFKLYIPNNLLKVTIIYSEIGLAGWPQSSSFTKDYFTDFIKSGLTTIDGILYTIYKYNNNGDVFFKIIN